MFLIYRKGVSAENMIPLTTEESRHLRARRMRVGDSVYVGDGVDRRYSGSLYDLRTVQLHTDQEVHIREEKPRILCTAIPDRNRWDWLLQKAAEAGVTLIQPVRFERSTPLSFSMERSLRILHEASAQSRRFFLPELKEPIDFKNIISEDSFLDEPGEGSFFSPSNTSSYICDASATESLADLWRSEQKPDRVALLVGPEGGISPAELEMARDRGWKGVTLGRTNLRVETAALVALASVIP